MNCILTVVLFIIMVAAIVATNYDLIHPAVIFSALWFISSFFYLLMANQWKEVCSSETLVFILMCNTLCVVSMVLYSKLGIKIGSKIVLSQNEIKHEKVKNYNCSWKRRILFFLLTCFYTVSTGMLLTRVRELASAASSYNSATNVVYLARIAEINGMGFGRLYINIMRLNIAIGIVLARKVAEMILTRQKGYGIYIPFLLYAIVFSLIRGSRNDMMYILGAYLFIFIYYIYKNSANKKQNEKKAFKYFIFFMLVIALVWGISGVFFGRVGASAIRSVITYVGGPLAGFNYLVAHPDSIPSNYFGQNTFDSIYKILSRFGLIDFKLAQNSYLPYTGNANFSINVYTIYGRYFADFGIAGSVVLILIFGQFYGLLYGRMKFLEKKKSEKWAILIYATCMFPLIMSFFEDRFFSFINNTILLVIIVLLLERFVFSDEKLILFSRKTVKRETIK